MTPETSSKGGLASLLETAIPQWRNRPDSEHEQAIIRLLIGTIAALYLIGSIISEGRDIYSEPTFYVILLFFLSAGCIVVWLFIIPKLSKIRRVFGIITDIVSPTLALYLNGNLATPLFVVYLWVTFGNGFRYGKPYLYFSMILSLAGFIWVISSSPHWHISTQITYGLLLGLFLLPLYVAALLGRLTNTMERLEKANNAKSTFLAVMSHEIRTPLSGILGLISLLKKSGLNEKQNHYLQLVEKSSEWLHRVISDGLDFSKVEANELIIDLTPFSLPRALADLVSFYQGVADAKGIQFTSSIDPNLPDCIAGDKVKLMQILNNLLANACKFTEEGEVGLSVAATHSDETKVAISFKVTDTGIGIANDEIDNVFKPFKQADSSTSRKFGGTGLGLTIADRIVHLMGGKITVNSKKGMGSDFKFTLVFPLAEFLKTTAPSRNEDNKLPLWLRPPRILLVEDHEINQEVLRQLLEVAGCEVGVATDGSQAVDLAHRQDWDLVFMDCQMPVVDGYEATRQIRKSALPRNAALPIIALTAHVTVADKNRCLTAGMSDYLGKPCTLDDITAMLRKWLTTLLSEDSLIEKVEEYAEPAEVEQEAELSVLQAEQRKQVHELRNFYTKIIGSAELALLKSDSPEEVRKFLKIILNETRKESALLQQRDKRD